MLLIRIGVLSFYKYSAFFILLITVFMYMSAAKERMALATESIC